MATKQQTTSLSPPRSPQLVRRVRSWPQRTIIAVGVVAAVLLIARISLPYVVKHLVNVRLARIPGYTGGVDDIGIHLWRGAYSLHEFRILKSNGRLQEPFFRAKKIDFSIAWRELWHRKIVSDIIIDQGQLNFVQGPNTEESQTDLDRRWQDTIQDIFPIDITRLVITDGLLRYRNTTREPTVDLFVTHMRATATGLRNRPGEAKSGEFPAQITIDGESLGGGILNLTLAAEPLADQPHFQLSLKLDDVNLPSLNETLKAYIKADVSRGTFRLVGEMAGRSGGFQGYVKPFFEDLEFKNVKDDDKSVGERVWKRVVAATAWVVKDKSRDQVATRIPYEGRFGDAKVGLLATIGNLFRHGFIRAFDPTIEGSVHADEVAPDGRSKDENDKEERAQEKLLERSEPTGVH